MDRRRVFCIFLTVMAGVIFFSSSVLAAWTISGRSINSLSMSSYKNTIVEEYQVPNHVEPGQKVVKEVNIKNEGDVDTFVRVRIERAFGTRNEEGLFQKDDHLDPEMILIHYNTDFWKRMPDGYWYYTDVLKAKETTKKPLMDSYRLSEKADGQYKSKEAQIIVYMESIQAEGGAMESLWGVKAKDLGITYQPCTCETVTKVTVNSSRKIVIDAKDTDLFVNFRNLVPGCSRTQTIRITNKSDGAIAMKLHAEAAEQDKMSSQQLALVKQLLTQYAVIQVKEGKTVLYQGTADGNLTKTGWSMKEDISLGNFGAGEGKSLVVTLSLSPEMDNQCQSILGKVQWVFTAEGEEKEKDQDTEGSKTGDRNIASGGSGKASTGSIRTASAISPKTGDDTRILPGLLLMAASSFCAVFSWKKLAGKERN